jgi:hypothetical protein
MADEELKVLKEKVELLEKFIALKEKLNEMDRLKSAPVYVPMPYPVYPTYPDYTHPYWKPYYNWRYRPCDPYYVTSSGSTQVSDNVSWSKEVNNG